MHGFQTLASLNPTKTPGMDNINPKVLKACADVLAEPLTNIFNQSLQQKTFPRDWKHYKIVPIHKKGDTRPPIYRPIIISSTKSPIETLVYNKVITFIRQNINKQQFGFLKNRSRLSPMLYPQCSSSFLSAVVNNADRKFAGLCT